MQIRWKNKNPYVNFYRETKRVLSSQETLNDKISLISSMSKRDYSGLWLFSHPSHKYLGDKVPTLNDDVSANPYYSLLLEVRKILLSEDTQDSKLLKIKQEFAWYSNESSLKDWVYSD